MFQSVLSPAAHRLSIDALPDPLLADEQVVPRTSDPRAGRHGASANSKTNLGSEGLSAQINTESRSLGATPGLRRATELAFEHRRTQPSGFNTLDAELPGAGWPTASLIELLAPQAGVGELRLLMPSLQVCAQQGRRILLLAPPHTPYAPALAQFGLDPKQLTVLEAPKSADRLWALEHSLRSMAFGALLCWLPETSQHPLKTEQLRRLQLAAQAQSGLCWAFRPLSASALPSPASLRLALYPEVGERLHVEILKRRGPPLNTPLVLDLPRPSYAPLARLRAAVSKAQASGQASLRSGWPFRAQALQA